MIILLIIIKAIYDIMTYPEAKFSFISDIKIKKKNKKSFPLYTRTLYIIILQLLYTFFPFFYVSSVSPYTPL